jgi:hypothetical protein
LSSSETLRGGFIFNALIMATFEMEKLSSDMMTPWLLYNALPGLAFGSMGSLYSITVPPQIILAEIYCLWY